MYMKLDSRRLTAPLAGFLFSLLLAAGANAQPAQIPQIPAFLPMAHTVPKAQAMPIDGTWTISSIGKRIRIEGGRAYAVDPWLHLFVLQIQPSMVVIKDIKPTGPGRYSGQDLPLMGQFDASVQADGTLGVSVAAMIPTRYTLTPVTLDNQAWFNQEMQAAGHTPAQSVGYQPSPPGGYNPAPPPQAQPVYQQPPPAYQQPNPGYQQPPPGSNPGYQQPPPGSNPGYQQPNPGYQQPPPGYQAQPGANPGYPTDPNGYPQANPGYQQPPATAPTGGRQVRSDNSALNDSPGVPIFTCGEIGGPACDYEEEDVAAEYIGEAEKWGCKDFDGRKNYFTPHNGGECWACPADYRRTIKPIHHPNTCNEEGWSRATASAERIGSAYGCGPDEFRKGKKCYACPATTEKIAYFGIFNPNETKACRTTDRKCGAGASVAPSPASVLTQVGPPVQEHCVADNFDLWDYLRPMAEEEMEQAKDVREAAAKFVTAASRNQQLKYALTNRQFQLLPDIIWAMPSFHNLRATASARGYNSFTIGMVGDAQLGWGANQEWGYAFDWEGGMKAYATTGVSKGPAIGVDLSLAVGLWKAEKERLGGYAHGLAASASGAVSVGGAVWFGYYPMEFAGVTVNAGGGVGLELGEYNETVTNIYDPDTQVTF